MPLLHVFVVVVVVGLMSNFIEEGRGTGGTSDPSCSSDITQEGMEGMGWVPSLAKRGPKGSKGLLQMWNMSLLQFYLGVYNFLSNTTMIIIHNYLVGFGKLVIALYS